MPHSYEEIRSVALDILSGREDVRLESSHYEGLRYAIAKVFDRREGRHSENFRLDNRDNDIFLELFWDLFRQGIITLGSNDANREFPHFRVTQTGKNILESQSTYFFHDVSSYEKIISSEIPAINDAGRAARFHSGSASRHFCENSVALGVSLQSTWQNTSVIFSFLEFSPSI